MAQATYTKDRSASRVIEQAIQEHYFVTDFDRAENVLLGVVEACGEKCRPGTLARAFMYLGVVRSSGKREMASAREAFVAALSYDANVVLDTEVATLETQALWEEVAAEHAADATEHEDTAPHARPAPAAKAHTDRDSRGSLDCSSDGLDGPAATCQKQVLCPPGFPCASLGEKCNEAGDCKDRLSCQRSPGEAHGTCQVPRKVTHKTPTRHRLGIAAALDVTLLPSGSDLCSSDTQTANDRDYYCYLGQNAYPDAVGAPVEGGAGKIDGGFAPGTPRLLVSYQFEALPNYALGARLGLGFGDVPKTMLLPHAEVDFTRYFRSERVLQPFVLLGAGYAETRVTQQLHLNDKNYQDGSVTGISASAVKVSDPFFACAGLGARLELARRLALIVRADAVVTLPSPDLTLRPALGVALGL